MTINLKLLLNKKYRDNYKKVVGDIINSKLTTNPVILYNDILNQIYSYLFEDTIELQVLNDIYSKMINIKDKLTVNIKKRKRQKNKVMLSIHFNQNLYNDMHILSDDKIILYSINKNRIEEDMNYLEKFYNSIISVISNLNIIEYRIISNYNKNMNCILDLLITQE